MARTASTTAKSAVAPAKKAPAKKSAATQAAAAKSAPAKKAATKTAVKKAAAATKTAPTKTAPTKTAPTKTAAKKAAAATKTAPTKTAPTKTEPTKTTPTKTTPTKTAPTKTASKKAAAATVAPVKKAVASKAAKAAPSGPPEGWTAKELAAVRADLQSQLSQMRADYAQTMEAIDELQSHGSDGAGDDQADAGSKTFEREHEMSLAKNRRDLIDQFEHAVERIDAGTYGLCESCGKPIAKARLQAFPAATLCVACKQREERR